VVPCPIFNETHLNLSRDRLPCREATLESIHAGLKYALADQILELLFPPGVAVELSRPLTERAIAVGDRDEADGGQ
jgi:hypothetical protein